MIDFGISRAADASVLTQTGAIMGSPGYSLPSRPKAARSGRPARCVLAPSWSSPPGVKAAFGTGPAVALAFRVVNSAPSLSGVPEQLRPMIERCLAKNPAAPAHPSGTAQPPWAPGMLGRTGLASRPHPTAGPPAASGWA